MKKKFTAVMAIITMLTASPIMNHVTAEASTFSIDKSYEVDLANSKHKSTNSSTGKINISNGVIPGSLHVDAYLVYKNSNGECIRSMDTMYFTSNQSQTETYHSGRGIVGKAYYLMAKVSSSSRFNETDLNYRIEP
jgi:hypothetical protein